MEDAKRLLATASDSIDRLGWELDELRAGHPALRHALAREFTYTGPHDYGAARAIVDTVFDAAVDDTDREATP